MWTDNHRIILLTTLAGFGLRLLLLDRFPFREDEAIYSFWALHGWRQDPLFLSVWPDKPPLFLWLLGAAYRLFGVELAAGRWLNIAASTLTIPIIAACARRTWGEQAALIAAIAMALSPFAISFAPTAFVDPVLVLFGSLALCMALFRRPFFAGLWLGAAIMTKQQGVLYLPLIVAVLAAAFCPKEAVGSRVGWGSVGTIRAFMTKGTHGTTNRASFSGMPGQSYQKSGFWVGLIRAYLRPSLFFLLGLAAITLPILWWDSLRWAVAPSPWDLSVRNYAAVALLPPDQWLSNLYRWMPLLWPLTASHALWLLVVLMAIAAVIVGRATSVKPDLLGIILVVWTIGYLLLHIMTSVQIWDRYLLPLAPMLALLVGWAAGLISRSMPATARRSFVGAVVVALAIPAWQAAVGLLPIGGDHGAYDGLDEAIAWIHAEADNAVIYHDVLGWHLQFYLYEQVRSEQLDLRWFPSSTYLADNAGKTPHRRKLYVAADWAAPADLGPRLDMRNLSLTDVAAYGHFTIYEVGNAPAMSCDWRLCVDEEVDTVWPIMRPHEAMTAISPATDQPSVMP